MRTLYLHVGTHKTGTTSLQAYLLDARERLKARGVHVVTERHRLYGETANCFGFAHAVLRPSLRSVARMTGAMPSRPALRYVARRHQLRSELARLPKGATAILSAEALCFARAGDERRRLAAALKVPDLKVIPVLCLRNQRDWRESWAGEIASATGGVTGSFGKGTDDVRGDWVFDVPSIRAFWEEIGPVREVDFDASVARHGSVLPALLGALDAPVLADIDGYRLRARA